MKIGIISDHHGYITKQEIVKNLINLGYEVIDYGTNSNERIDHPDYAFLLGEKLNNKEVELGISLCKTGIGMAIGLNKVKGVMCAKINSKLDAKMAKEHNNVNALSFNEENTASEITDFIKIFLNAKFLGEKDESYQRRIDKIKAYEDHHES